MAEPRVHLTYGDAKQQILEVLLLCAAEHDSERLVGLDPAIDTRFDHIDSALPRHAGPEFDKLIIAFEFALDGWIRAITTGSFTKGSRPATGRDWRALLLQTWKQIVISRTCQWFRTSAPKNRSMDRAWLSD